jgi:hypothetical protein
MSANSIEQADATELRNMLNDAIRRIEVLEQRPMDMDKLSDLSSDLNDIQSQTANRVMITDSEGAMTTSEGLQYDDADGNLKLAAGKDYLVDGKQVVPVEAHAATSKTTPDDDDEIPFANSAMAWVLGKFTWANIKTALAALFAPIGRTLTGTSPITIDGDNSAHDLSANRTIAIPAATASAPGHATAAQITKLDGIAAGAQVNVLEGVTGTAPIVAGAIAAKSQAISITAASAGAAGSMSAADFAKLSLMQTTMATSGNSLTDNNKWYQIAQIDVTGIYELYTGLIYIVTQNPFTNAVALQQVAMKCYQSGAMADYPPTFSISQGLGSGAAFLDITAVLTTDTSVLKTIKVFAYQPYQYSVFSILRVLGNIPLTSGGTANTTLPSGTQSPMPQSLFIGPSGGMAIGDGTDAGDNNLYVANNVSALSYTDRTPFYNGDALREIKKISGKGGLIDHATLPDFVKVKRIDKKGEKDEIIHDERNLGAMVSVLTVATQQLLERIEKLDAK